MNTNLRELADVRLGCCGALLLSRQELVLLLQLLLQGCQGVTPLRCLEKQNKQVNISAKKIKTNVQKETNMNKKRKLK